ncbi:hypothetical protein GCM10022402_21230 [Salinactinospora qingdaonensis]|uniref:O-methyltransferase n=2 Tax=Salinactinospora qingdaonensis TaxID=702744 RepID=A0ABP7FQ87_9ACTN
MRSDGILTSVDVVPEYLESARGAFSKAGFAANRTRLIHGRALEVLPRLTDGAYDMVFMDAVKTEYPAYLQEALRLLRRGGIAVFNNALDAPHPDEGPLGVAAPEAAAVRDVGQLVREDERLIPLMLPVGDGLLAVIRNG